jgi:hypothetical protein
MDQVWAFSTTALQQKKKKEKKRKIHNPINTHSFQKKLLSL